MITFPNAKINLGLNITARRSDGYHNIESVFYPIGLTDALEVVPAHDGCNRLNCSGIPIDCPVEKNIVYRTLLLMQECYAIPPVHIYLHKTIPFGAGFGGGSSDASALAKLLNEQFELKLSQDELAQSMAKIGADCPFFIYNTPMFCTGIGEILTPFELSLKGFTLLLIKPNISVATAEAYRGVTPQQPVTPITEILTQNIHYWQGQLTNDFEISVFEQYPTLASIKKQILQCGAVYAAMSGSGSSIYGIFESANMAEKAKETIAQEQSYVIELR